MTELEANSKIFNVGIGLQHEFFIRVVTANYTNKFF